MNELFKKGDIWKNEITEKEIQKTEEALSKVDIGKDHPIQEINVTPEELTREIEKKEKY